MGHARGYESNQGARGKMLPLGARPWFTQRVSAALLPVMVIEDDGAIRDVLVDGVTLLDRLGEIAEHEDAFRVLIFSASPLANDLRGRRFVAGVLSKPCKLAHLLFAVRQAAMPA